MSTIQVQAPGLQTTVQDLGREGFGPIGVSPSGAADPISLRLGNRLVGNDQGAAALEMMLLGGTFIFPEGAVVALTGSDFGATLDDARLEWEPRSRCGPAKRFDSVPRIRERAAIFACRAESPSSRS